MLNQILIPVLMSFPTVATQASTITTQAVTLEQARQQIDDALPGELANDPLSFQWETWGPRLRARQVDTPAIPGGTSVQVEIKKAAPNKWDVGINVPIVKNIAAGEKVRIYMWARSDDETEISTRLQQSFEPYNGFGDFQPTITNEWKLISYEAIADRTLEGGKAALTIQLGAKKQSVEIGQIYVTREAV